MITHFCYEREGIVDGSSEVPSSDGHGILQKRITKMLTDMFCWDGLSHSPVGNEDDSIHM